MYVCAKSNAKEEFSHWEEEIYRTCHTIMQHKEYYETQTAEDSRQC